MTNVDLVTTEWNGLKNISAESVKISLNGTTMAALSSDGFGHGFITIGSTTLNESQLQQLLALLNAPQRLQQL